MKGGSVIQADRVLKILAAVIAVLLHVQSCTYTLTGNLPAHLETVSIVSLRSQVAEYGLAPELTSYVTEGFVSNGRLSVVTMNATSELEGKITSWQRTPYSYTSSEVVEEYKIQIRVEMTFTDTVEDEVILNRENISTWIVYDPASETESDARTRLLQQSAEDIVERCLSGW